MICHKSSLVCCFSSSEVVTVKRSLRGELLVREEIGRQGGEIAGGSIRVSLASRAVESHDQNRTTPRLLGLNTSSYPLDSVVNWRSSGQRKRAVEDVKRVAQGFSV